jgi:uncharacterized protein (TIGR02246 family)
MNSMANEDGALHQLVATYADAWNRGDGAGFASVFAQDADFTSIRLDRVHNRADLAAGHQAIFDTVYKGTRLQADVESIRYVRPDVAVLNVDGQLVQADGVPVARRRSHALAVAERLVDGWRIVAFQNLVPVTEPS